MACHWASPGNPLVIAHQEVGALTSPCLCGVTRCAFSARHANASRNEMMMRNSSCHRWCACLCLENLGVLLVCHIDGRRSYLRPSRRHYRRQSRRLSRLSLSQTRRCPSKRPRGRSCWTALICAISRDELWPPCACLKRQCNGGGQLQSFRSLGDWLRMRRRSAANSPGA